MLTENQEKWVQALESGQYKQGVFQLRTGHSFCCLGVACDISGVSKWYKEYCYDGYDKVLPESVRDWLGLLSIDPKITLNEDEGLEFRPSDKCEPTKFMTLSALNDRGVSFERIAKLIRSHEKELFRNGEEA